MLSRIMLPEFGDNPFEREEHDAWGRMVAVLGAEQVETHPRECECDMPACIRLLAVRRYVSAHLRAKRLRRMGQGLQKDLDDYVQRANENEIGQAYQDAKVEYMDRQFKEESQYESR